MPIPSSVAAQFEVYNPRAAALLSLADLSGLEWCRTERGEQNIVDRRGGGMRYLHAQSGALREAEAWISARNVDVVDLLVVFGLGLGWTWRALIPWLEGNRRRRVIFVEDDLAVTSAFLQSDCAQEFFDHPQTTLFFFEPGDEGKRVFEIIAWNAYERSWSYLASPTYARDRHPLFEQLVRDLTVLQTDVSDVLREFFSFGETPLRNFIRNVFLWKRSRNGTALFHQFRGCPAIVVAAGPSLDDELETLRKVHSKALILAGGSSIGALLQSGIMPHMAATVDPNPTQYIRLRQAQPFALPLLYRSRALHEGLMYHKGPLLYLRGGDGYPLVEWFEHALGAFGSIVDGGHSVSNMLIEAAHAFGCRPIIMVGYDLAYTDGGRYSKALSESMAAGETAHFSGTTRGELITGRTHDGREVCTEAKWKTEAEWIEGFQRRHPRLHIVNTSRNGLAVSGTEVMSLQEALERYCLAQHDIDGRLHLAIQEAPWIAPSNEKISKAMHAMGESLRKTIELLKFIQPVAARATNPEESAELVDAHHELEQQLAFRWVLGPVAAMHAKLAQMRRYLECRPLLDVEQSVLFEGKMCRDRYTLLLECARAHEALFFSMVSWGYLNGHFLPGAMEIAQMPHPPSRRR